MQKTEIYPYSKTAQVSDGYIGRIEHLSPSVKLVFKVLEYKGLMTQKELVAESYLPPRTVRWSKKPAARRNHIKLCMRRSIVFKVQDQFWQHGIKQFT